MQVQLINKSDGAQRPSVLHLVVGPSGVGKDTLLEALRRHRQDLYFAQRMITRAADAGGEAHQAISEQRFRELEQSGGFLLSWRAHGLAYGAPIQLQDVLATPRHVVLNVSRRVIDEARHRWSPIRVLSIEAPQKVLAARLAARGRETPEAILERLNRKAGPPLRGTDIYPIDNGGDLEIATRAMLDACAAPIGAT